MTFKIIAVIVSIASLIFSIIYKFNIQKKDSLYKIKKRFDIYKEILTNNNEILSHTYLKDYLGVPIDTDMIKYIINSPYFYEFISFYKYIYRYIEFDTTNNTINFKKNKDKLNRKLYVILYIIFAIPFLLFILFFDCIIQDKNYLLVSIIVLIPSLIAAIYSMNEIGCRTLAIKFLNKLRETMKIEIQEKK